MATNIASRAGAPLELGEDGGGARYFLEGQRVSNGDIVEIAAADGTWIPARLEGLPQQRLAYLVELAGGAWLMAELPRSACCRWPERTASGR